MSCRVVSKKLAKSLAASASCSTSQPPNQYLRCVQPVIKAKQNNRDRERETQRERDEERDGERERKYSTDNRLTKRVVVSE